MNKLNILHISTASTWRGGEQQVAYLMEELSQKNIQQAVFCIKNGAFHQYADAKGFQTIPFKKGFSVNPLVARKLAQTVQKNQINIIHTHDSHAHSFAILATRFFGMHVPLVVSRRVDFPISKNRFSLRKYSDPAVKRILCVSNEIRSIVLQDIPKPDLVSTVYSGIDLSKWSNSSSNKLREAYNISSKQPLIVNVGALADHKDQITFVETIALIHAKYPDVRALIIGRDQGEKNAIEDRIRALSLEGIVQLTGFRSDIPIILPEADVFLFTSKTEGLGTSILDAFAAKVPVVSTPAGGIPELIIHEQTGLIGGIKNPSQLAEQVIRLLEEPALVQQLIAGANQHLQQFTKEQTAKQTLKVYQQILDQQHP